MVPLRRHGRFVQPAGSPVRHVLQRHTGYVILDVVRRLVAGLTLKVADVGLVPRVGAQLQGLGGRQLIRKLAEQEGFSERRQKAAVVWLKIHGIGG